MSERPFLAARIEEAINRKVEAALRLARWTERVVPYIGYGSTRQVRVMGRVVLAPPRDTHLVAELEDLVKRRGWRNFMAACCVRVPVRVRIGDTVTTVWTDRGGYVDVRIDGHGLGTGWHEIEIWSRLSEPTRARVQIIGDDQRFGIVSDIDDTVITTWLPRLLIAAYNSFWLTEGARKPVEGMAELYQRILAERPGAPVIYLSTGSYDTFPFLQRFLKQYGFPEGPLLLTDWGPTNTGWFRSGQEHKRRSLRELARDFPRLKWLLVGDDGQHDPEIYSEFAQHLPKRVRAIGIRQLTEKEHTLAHGTPSELPGQSPHESLDAVPEVRAPEGRRLWDRLAPIVRRKRRHDGTPEHEPVEEKGLDEAVAEAQQLPPAPSVPAGEQQVAPPA